MADDNEKGGAQDGTEDKAPVPQGDGDQGTNEGGEDKPAAVGD